jgi:hypothetical protein
MKNKTEETEQSDKEGYNVLIASHSEDLDWLRFLPKERDYKVIVSNSNERKKIDNCDLVLNILLKRMMICQKPQFLCKLILGRILLLEIIF